MRKCPAPHTPPVLAAIHRFWGLPLVAVWIVACTPAGGEQGARSGAPGTRRPSAAARQGSTSARQATGPGPNHAWVIFGKDTVVAEVARTEAAREHGLMDRQEVPAGTGMLFVFDDMQQRSFWMQNTYVALDIAFMDASYRIVNIDHMAPLTTTSHESEGPAMFALEVPEGWYAAHGVKAGDHAIVVYGIQLKTSGG
jgi:uncharacterized protein